MTEQGREITVADDRLMAAATRMLAFIRRVAWEPIGRSDAGADEILAILESEAKSILRDVE